MFNLFKSLFKINIYKNEKYYEKIKELTKLIKEKEGKNNNIWCQNIINNIRLTIWIEDNLTTINIKIVENTAYEFSLNFDNNKYTFIQTNWDFKGNPKTINLDIFEESIEIIFLDTIDKTIDYFFNKLQIQKNDKYIKQTQDAKVISDLSSSIKNNSEKVIDDLTSDIKSTLASINEDLENKLKSEQNDANSLIETKKNIIDINMALKSKDFDLVIELIKRREEIDKKDENGNTPLMNIIMANNISNKFKQYEMIGLLLEKDADVYIKNNYNFNILEIIEHKEYYVEIRKIFEKYNYFKNTKNENDKYLISLKESTIKEIDQSSNIDSLKNRLKSNQINESLLIGTKEINDNKLHIEKNSLFIEDKEELKSIIELQFKTIKKLEEDLQLQLKEIHTIKKDSKDEKIKQTQQINELISKIEKFDKIEVQSKIIKELDNQLLLQSKIIKNLEEHLRSQSNEINKIKKDYEKEQTIYVKELLQKIENFNGIEIQLKNIKNLDNQLLLQSKEIYNIKKEFLDKEIKQTLYINELVQKIEKLEELLKNKPSNKSEKKPLIMPIQIEKQTINKTNGELIKRDSFDDF